MDPNPDQIYVIVLASLELRAPVVGIKVAAEEVQGVVALFLPRLVYPIEENFFAISVEFIAAYRDVQRTAGF